MWYSRCRGREGRVSDRGVTDEGGEDLEYLGDEGERVLEYEASEVGAAGPRPRRRASGGLAAIPARPSARAGRPASPTPAPSQSVSGPADSQHHQPERQWPTRAPASPRRQPGVVVRAREPDGK